VAHSLSAKKRIRQNIKRRARNRARKEVLKDQVKSFMSAIAGGDVNKAKEEFKKTTQRLDKVAAKRTIHKNAASRKRSRLAKRLNAMIATGGAPKAHGKGTKAAKASS
jgi:small subunit ribosomal protein S20